MQSNELIKLEQFFSNEIDAKQFAKYMRRINHALVHYALEDDDKMFKEWVSDGYFWLNNFVETLDPQIEDEVA